MDYVDKEEFLTMVTEVWTIEKQAADRERWAREEEKAKAEKKIKADKLETVKRLLKMGLSNTDVAHGAGVDIDVVVKVSQSSDF